MRHRTRSPGSPSIGTSSICVDSFETGPTQSHPAKTNAQGAASREAVIPKASLQWSRQVERHTYAVTISVPASPAALPRLLPRAGKQSNAESDSAVLPHAHVGSPERRSLQNLALSCHPICIIARPHPHPLRLVCEGVSPSEYRAYRTVWCHLDFSWKLKLVLALSYANEPLLLP